MAGAGKDPAARAARQRARLYEARRAYHASLGRRRRRDDLVAGIVGGLLVIGIAAAQVAYFVVGPAAPSVTSVPTPAQSASPTPAQSATPTPAASETPSPTATP